MRARKGQTLDIGERLVAVETKVDQLMEDGLTREEKLDNLKETIDELKTSVQEFKSEIAKYRGFVGGALFVVTGLGVVLMNVFGPLWGWFTKAKTGG